MHINDECMRYELKYHKVIRSYICEHCSILDDQHDLIPANTGLHKTAATSWFVVSSCFDHRELGSFSYNVVRTVLLCLMNS